MNIDEKRQRIEEISALTSSLYTEQYQLKQELEREEFEQWIKDGIPAKVEWELRASKIVNDPDNPNLYLDVVGNIPNEYFKVFRLHHDSIYYGDLKFGVDDWEAWMYGPSEKVLEFIKQNNLRVKSGDLMDAIRTMSTRLFAVKGVYCQIKGITLDDIKWPES